MITGVGVSRGFAFGPAAIVASPTSFIADEPKVVDFAAASLSVREALRQVAEGLRAKAGAAPEGASTMLEASAMMAEDPSLANSIDEQLHIFGVTRAVYEAVQQYASMLTDLGGYMAERVTDLHDVRDRVIARLQGMPEPGIPTMNVPSILVADDLAPSETAMLDPAMCLGIITKFGGPTSHTTILAGQLGIPAIVQATSLDVMEGARIAMDGNSGQIIVSPTDGQLLEFRQRQDRRSALSAGSSMVGATKDSCHIALLANIGSVADAQKAAERGLEGIGLFRTEFLFLDRAEAPSVEEQKQTYAAVLKAFPHGHVVIRTLDAGADKPLAFADLGYEPNPALGRRGLRLGMIRKDLLDAQLQSLAAAYRTTGSDLWVMAPMVATVGEAKWFADAVRSFDIPKAGVMIEIPAAALRAREILKEADFASLGTNDLQQYTLAVDRLQGGLAELLDPWQPAVLDVIAAACEGAFECGKPIGVCGESGGDPGLALVLTGLGVTSLSMSISKAPAVKTALSLHTLQDCQDMAQAARQATGPQEAKAVVLAMASPLLRDLL